MYLRLSGRKHAPGDLLGYPAMVLRELPQLAVSEEVRPAVPDVAYRQGAAC